ncbi:class I adenylate-forming enzyme family protein [Microbacterium koreense]|uniref:Class I adenylate-forming enzyme family protein n=1 Tax=Microbacterium koreense TaxID=323761 RepID=A0ABW2ZS19_9MICO
MSTDSVVGTAPFAPEDTSEACAYQGDVELTWADWNDRANRLASAMDSMGVKPGDVVAIRVRTRIEWLVISLAISKLNAIGVAVNYRLTAPESAYILRDCNVRVAIIDDDDPAETVKGWAELGLLGIISLDRVADGTLSYEALIAEGDPTHRDALDLAPLIIYSSGTTGAPKGAPINGWQNPPDPKIHAEYNMSVAFDGAAAGPGNRTLINLPMHHGAGPGFTRASLMSGGKVVFDRKFEPEATLALIERSGITHWIAVPTMLQRLVNLPAETTAKYDLSSLRFLLGGAAPFDRELKDRATALLGRIIHENYGCTEAGMLTGATPDDLEQRPGTSGRPFRHVEIKIIDEAGVELRAGATGEIAVRTPTVITGYIGRGPLGPDKLLPDGFYRTGDIGHLDADGYLFIYDRITDVVISGGVNIYPAEIEAVLNTHPAVAVSAVFGVKHEEAGEQAVAAVQLRPGATATADDLLAFCEGKLAKYKWPRRFEFVDVIPTSPMGKILKRVLREEIR